MAASDRRVLLVTRRTRLEGVLAAYGTRGQARFCLVQARRRLELSEEESEAAFEDMQREHAAQERAREEVRRQLEGLLPVQAVDRQLLPTMRLGPSDIVAALGQDGLVANVAKYALSRPILGINPDPERFDGVLLPFLPGQIRGAVKALLAGRAELEPVTLAEARLQDGQRLLAFNDLFVGVRTHASARYRLRAGRDWEQQSSSGVLVSTGAGSSGWLSSVLNMAQGVCKAFATETKPPALHMERHDRRLAWTVREPFASRTSGVRHIAGLLDPGKAITIESLMEDDGVIFSDGVHADSLVFRAGAVAEIRAAEEQALLVRNTG